MVEDKRGVCMIYIVIGGLLWGVSFLFLLDAELDLKRAREGKCACDVQKSKKIVKYCFVTGLIGAVIMVMPLLN